MSAGIASRPFGTRQVRPDAPAYASRDRPVDALAPETPIEPAQAPAQEAREPKRASDKASDRRTANRERRLLAARLVYANGDFSVDCVLRDVSESGGRLDELGEITVPDSFRIVNMRRRTIVPARLVWRRNNEAGVVWTGPVRNLETSTDLEDRQIVRNLGFSGAGS